MRQEIRERDLLWIVGLAIGFGLVALIEAKAAGQCCGRPVIVSRTYSRPTVVAQPVAKPARITTAQAVARLLELKQEHDAAMAGIAAIQGTPAPRNYAQPQAAAQPYGVAPYQTGDTQYAYTRQSVEIFGETAFDRLAALIDGQQRAAAQSGANAAAISAGVQQQVDSLGASMQSVAASESQTKRLATVLEGVILMLEASEPEPSLSIKSERGPADTVEAGPPPVAAAGGVAACVKCHKGAEAKGGLRLDGSQVLSPAQFSKAVGLVLGDKMPPESEARLSTEQKTATIEELRKLTRAR